MVRIIIAGGRDFSDYELLKRSVHAVIDGDRLKEHYPIEFISGAARGADKLGEKFATENIYFLKRFPADWDRYGKRAGYIRNEQMAKYASEDNSYGILIAFWDGESKGTKLMIDLAKRYGLEIHVINY